MSAPDTVLYVCSGVSLNSAYQHTILFETPEAQEAYFRSKVARTFTELSYLRKSWSVRLECTLEQARAWTYLFFRNAPTGKMYYYFINNVEYISDDVTELSLEMDVMQTYHFDYALQNCFVEREHASSDEIGDNLVEENLDLGELVVNGSKNVDMQELYVLLLTTFDPYFDADSGMHIGNKKLLDGVYSGLYLSAIPATDYQKLSVIIEGWNSETDARIEGLVAMWMYPKALLETSHVVESDNDLLYVHGGSSFDVTQGRIGNLDGYSPRNNKLWTFPYNFLYVSNNAGGSALYKYEHFGDPTACAFRITGTPSPEGGTKLFPVNYKGVLINYEEGLNGANYPTCAWNSDVYKLWLAQNQNQNMLNVGSNVVQMGAGMAMVIAGAFTGGLTALAGGGMFSRGLGGILQQLARMKDMEVQPPQAKGSHSASLNIANEHQTFTVQRKSVSKEFAKILDGFFDMFGYACKQVKTPNRKARARYTYTKTQNCFIKGSLCNEDAIQIQTIYDHGITFWLDGDDIGNYPHLNANNELVALNPPL